MKQPHDVKLSELNAHFGDDPETLARVRRIMQSPSYRLAEEDLEFIAGDETRPVRLLLEYLKPQMAFAEQRIRSTVVLFGGTRIVEAAEAERRLQRAVAARDAAPGDAGLERAVKVAERIVAKSPYYEVARDFARMVSQTSQTHEQRDYVITTGGGPGVMEAGNRGADDAGAQSIGLNITLPMEQFPNPYITPELCFQFRYFALRKMHFLRLAVALVAFPGGYGTLDELFDTLCLVQTRKMDPLPVVLVGEEFWRGMLDFQFMVDEGVIAERDLDLFCYAETAQEISDRILDWYGLDPGVIPDFQALVERRREAGRTLLG